MKIHNFSAGPAILPASVLEKASEALLNFDNTGLSVAEVSHRSAQFVKVIERARALALELAGLDNSYEALYLQGGASMQFLMVPYNLLENKAAYIDTGTWANKAQKEAALFGEVQVIASSKEQGYKSIPKNVVVLTDIDYLHITTNNTIYGSEFHSIPKSAAPIVADMSSDIFSRSLDYSQFGLVYAGSQKNLGASGSTLVLIKKDLLGKVSRKLPSMMDYQLHIKNESMFNTPSTFSVYVNMLVLEWIKAEGGLAAMEKRNKEKADLLYSEIDRNAPVVGYTAKEDRSLMNVVFNLTDESTKDRFDALCKEANISGIKGHRSVGGYRASIYNAMPLESVQVLVEVLKEFERTA